MKPEALDRRITIQCAAISQDETGQEILTWASLPAVWASWRRASARETLAAAEVNAQVTDVFEIRYSRDVESVGAKDRILYGGRTYDIVDVNEIGRREGIRITASARSDV